MKKLINLGALKALYIDVRFTYILICISSVSFHCPIRWSKEKGTKRKRQSYGTKHCRYCFNFSLHLYFVDDLNVFPVFHIEFVVFHVLLISPALCFKMADCREQQQWKREYKMETNSAAKGNTESYLQKWHAFANGGRHRENHFPSEELRKSGREKRVLLVSKLQR